jgi:type VI secretion system protein ImpH
MASEGRRDGSPVTERLVREPGRFNFFQAVRLLERLSLVQSLRGRGPRRDRVGEDGTPQNEAARFHTTPSHAFPAVSVQSVRTTSGKRAENATGPPPDVHVSFLGLVGPLGALPQHYTRLALSREREKDRSLRDFLDLFQHRLISLFYRAWSKSRITEDYARRVLDPGVQEEDLVTSAVYSLVGMYSDAVRGGGRLDPEVFVRYSGLFADRRRNAVSLEQMLQDCLQLPVSVRQFQGEWLALPPDDQSCLSPMLNGGGCLGVSAILGARVWSVQTKFRVRLGPFGYATARRFMPTGDRIAPLCQLVRAYVGGEFRFDVQLVIFGDEIPPCRLGGDPGEGSRLGWNTWVLSQPLQREVDDAVFEGELPAVERQFANQTGDMYTVEFAPQSDRL